MDLRSRVSEELLPYVSSPAQYIGGEVNQLVAPGDWQRADVRVAIAFPDTYSIGMSHLGCQIIYWLCNHTPGVCAERVYVPWIDAERRMRDRGIELFTWDTRQPVSRADIFAISLQYEMAYTNILTLLDLAGIPFRSADRDDSHPLVIAGGPQADNPEPVAEFLDLIVIGDGEDSMAAVLATYKELKDNGVRRRDMIAELAHRYPYIYAPALYDVSYNADGTVRTIEPRDSSRAGNCEPRDSSRADSARDKSRGSLIERCQTPDFQDAPFPVRPLVPHVEVIHDRISIEIMRGCPQRCRFCHAGYTKRPLRLRTVDRILDIAEEAWRATGHDEIGLLSLSTADYPDLRELSDRINQRFTTRNVNISVPSLRVDKMLKNIPFLVNSVRKGGLTIAVEAAEEDMRAAIRKKVVDGDLLEGVRAAYAAGWRSVKLYFMAGFPGERPKDIDGIVKLARQVSEARKEFKGHPASVNASVGWLVPKPHTPFQWAAQPRAEYFEQVRRRLRELQHEKKSAVKVKMHDVQRSVLEAVFSRGDRRLSTVIETAWRNGARFDGWDEAFNHQTWQQAFQTCGIDPDFYAHRERPSGELFPWSHLAGPRTEYLEHQYDDVFTQLSLDREPALTA